MRKLSMIMAINDDGVIGRTDGSIPWHAPRDLHRFKNLTAGHVMIMGRKTADTFDKPLPGRVSIVLTHDQSWSKPGFLVAHSVDDAHALAWEQAAKTRRPDRVFIIGGSEVYRQFADLIDDAFITAIDCHVTGDDLVRLDPHFLPFWAHESVEHAKDDKNPGMRFMHLTHKPPPRS